MNNKGQVQRLLMIPEIFYAMRKYFEVSHRRQVLQGTVNAPIRRNTV